MSISSYTTFTCTFPIGTHIANSTFFHTRLSEDKSMNVIEWEADTGYCENILRWLNETFGRRIDEVPGLTLDLHYTTDEDEQDGHWEFYIKLKDGKWRYEESELVFKEKPIDQSYVDLDAGTPLWVAKRIWRDLEDVTVDDDECIDTPLLISELGWYPKGTFREDIWHDIEERTGISVAYLMGEAKNPDGSN